MLRFSLDFVSFGESLRRVSPSWLGFLAICLWCNAINAKEPLNVLFILADDLGWRDLGCYGQEKIPTPNIDRLASQGIRFTQHYSGAPVCAPARCTLMTGKYLGHAEIRGNKQARLKFPEFTAKRSRTVSTPLTCGATKIAYPSIPNRSRATQSNRQAKSKQKTGSAKSMLPIACSPRPKRF